jgi:nicotinate-nucleotide pyrophosphorylase (carboxylating)
MQDFYQINWDAAVEQDCRVLVQMALAEDLGGQQDWTTTALVPANRTGAARIVAREAGVAAGLPGLPIVIAEAQASLEVSLHAADGQHFEKGAAVVEIHGNIRDLLTLERTVLNFLGR